MYVLRKNMENYPQYTLLYGGLCVCKFQKTFSLSYIRLRIQNQRASSVDLDEAAYNEQSLWI